MGIIQLIGTPLYQWDSDRSIEVFPPDLSCSIDEVHAGSVGGTGAYNLVTVRADDKVTCEIPNILLQATAGIRVFGVMRTSAGRRTIIERTFSVKPRPKPDDYVYTETEIRDFANLDERITALEQGGGVPGDPGEDGGYYVPTVSQVDKNTMNVSFTASKEEMPAVADQSITLPSGTDGMTPYIGDNGNWFIGDTDTGKPSRGKAAPDEAVLYLPQTLTPEQQAQARQNIGIPDLPTEENNSYRLIAKIVFDETNLSDTIEITQDMDGNPLELTKLVMYADWQAHEEGRSDAYLSINNGKKLSYICIVDTTAYKHIATVDAFDGFYYLHIAGKIADRSSAAYVADHVNAMTGSKINHIRWYVNKNREPPVGSVLTVYGY